MSKCATKRKNAFNRIQNKSLHYEKFVAMGPIHSTVDRTFKHIRNSMKLNVLEHLMEDDIDFMFKF